MLKAEFGTKAPGSNPLALIRDECIARNLCDELGFRRPGVHWVFSVAITPEQKDQVCCFFHTCTEVEVLIGGLIGFVDRLLSSLTIVCILS